VAFGKEKLSVKRRSWILLGVLVAAMFVLAGCGVPFEGVDVATVPPDGPWQTFVVWPLANVLLWLDGVLKGAGVPYHWGFTIILFTLLVKLITFPLSLTQIRSMEAQKTLQPQLQDLQKKYGKDREALAQAQMKLYQESGVNPLSSDAHSLRSVCRAGRRRTESQKCRFFLDSRPELSVQRHWLELDS
jgi:YidC/Oxa1 family membrane protein insertase